ncbi:MAG: hypothetical protein IT273_04075 [Chitinophagales bacterium]|jgi:hypothetical protein|nr:hypothetical protein [Chitinophagales bacterium]
MSSNSVQNLTVKSFDFTSKEKKFSLILLIVGIVLFGIGVATNLDSPTRIWSTLVYNNFFFLMVALCAMFFISANNIGYSGWFIAVRRIQEAIALFVPIGAVLMLITLGLGFSHVYHWGDPDLVNPDSPKYDAILASKEWYLNKPFFWARIISYAVVWSALILIMRRMSLASDTNPDLGAYQRSKYLTALFILFFAVTSSTSSWDVLMSVQPHWYSTLFGWYNFISAFVTVMAITMLFFIYLRNKGYLPHANDSHMHDIGTFMFGFSIAWAYLFYSQFMLIWYSNMPEETIYFKERIDHYPATMYFLFMINFVAPFFILLTRGAKRSNAVVIALACLIIIGHWLDYYQEVVPGALANMAHGAHGEHAKPHYANGGIGIIDIGLFLTYAGIFTYVVFNALSKAPLLPVGHPFAKETLYHNI